MAAQPCQQEEEQQRVLKHLAKQQHSLLDQQVAVQAQKQLWDHLAQVVRQTLTCMITAGVEGQWKPTIHIPKVTSEDDPEAFLNSFEGSNPHTMTSGTHLAGNGYLSKGRGA